MPMDRDIFFYIRQRLTTAMVPSSKVFILLFLLSLLIFAESANPGSQKRITKGSKFGHLFGRGPFGLGIFPGGGQMISGGDNSDPPPSDDTPPDDGTGASSGPLDGSRKILNKADKGDHKGKKGDKANPASLTDASQPNNGGPVIGPDGNPITTPEKPRFESNSLGKWRIATPNVGVAAMQLQTMPNDKVVWFDTTFLGPSALQWNPPGKNCPINFETNVPDCYVHAIEYDGIHETTRPLTVCK